MHPVKVCPCCNQNMKYNEWGKYHVCRCQGTLLEYAELEAIAKNKSNGTHAAGITLSPDQVNPHLSPQALGSAQVQLPDTEFYTVTIPSSYNDKKFLANNRYNFDFRNKVWFKKVRATDYTSEKAILDRNSVTHEVLSA